MRSLRGGVALGDGLQRGGSSRLAVLLTLLMLSALGSSPGSVIESVQAGQISNFGNSGMPSSVNMTFSSAGYDASTNLTLSAGSVVSAASLGVRGWPTAAGESPRVIGVDIGDDGDIEWAFGGPGNGSFGHLTELSNGWSRVGLNLSNGFNTSYTIRLPADATVTSASLNISTLSQMTLTGNNTRDAYMHQPNPTWGNVTHKSCNYGNSTHVTVGKTQWSNWHNYRGLYWFDLSLLPMATVLDANLSLWVDDVVNHATNGQPVTNQYSYDLHPLLKDWQEGMENDLPVQQAAGVTWNDAIDNLTGTDSAWSAAGASGASDRGAAVASIIDSPANLEQTWMSFNSTSLTDLVQGWANGSIRNRGVLMVGDETTNKPQGSMLKITARGNSTHAPRLVVVFEGSDDVTAGFDVGDDGSAEWSHVGLLGNGSQIPDFSAALNSLLGNATTTFTDDWGNEFVDIPLNVTGNATLVLGDIDIRYDWNPTVTTAPHGDLVSEIDQHLTNLTADATGNVSIPINVSSDGAGIVELSRLLISFGDRSPSVGSFILPIGTMLPDGTSFTLGLELTCYQGLANLSWIALTPMLSDIASRPMLVHSLVNGTSWVEDAAGIVANVSGQWQELNEDTGRMEWQVEVGWDWLPEQGVVWEARAGTLDGLHTERASSATTDHERRVEIDSFHLWDETSPSDGGPEVFADEWVAGGDALRVSGTVRFLNEARRPRAGDVLVELHNVSGNGSIDANGAFSIPSQAPAENRYAGFTITASIYGGLDATPAGTAVRTFRIDDTLPGLQVNSPSGERVLPDGQQLLNVTIADTIGMDDASLRLRWWAEARHDDGDRIAEIGEYGSLPLLRQVGSDHFHAYYDDSDNPHGRLVSLFIEGNDIAGNPVMGGDAGIESDLVHYITLVPAPPTIHDAILDLAGGDVLVPAHTNWLNASLYDENGLQDIESVVIDIGQGYELEWQRDGELTSNDPELVVESFGLTGEAEQLSLNVSFHVTPRFSPLLAAGDIDIHVSDSSGVRTLGTGLQWTYDADITLVDHAVSLAGESGDGTLADDSFVSLGTRLVIGGRVRYTAADLPPPTDSYEIRLEVPLDLPRLVAAADDGSFSGQMDVLGSGLYRATLEVTEGPGEVNPEPLPVRLIVDDAPPLIIGHEPLFLAANASALSLRFDLREVGAGLSNDSIPIVCSVRRGFDQVGEPVLGDAVMLASGEVSRYMVNLSFTPMRPDDSLDCALQVSDLAGNGLSGVGSATTWPLSLPVFEIRPDFVIDDLTISPVQPLFGQPTLVNVTVVNLGNHTDRSCTVILEALGEEVGNESLLLPAGTSSTVVSFVWMPDWLGELDLIVHIDPDDVIEERDEDNSRAWTVEVGEVPKDGFLGSGSSLAGAGLIGLLVLLGVGATLLILRSRVDDEYEEWLEDDEPAT